MPAREKVLKNQSKITQQYLENFDITSAGKFVMKRPSRGFILGDELVLSDEEPETREPVTKRQAIDADNEDGNSVAPPNTDSPAKHNPATKEGAASAANEPKPQFGGNNKKQKNQRRRQNRERAKNNAANDGANNANSQPSNNGASNHH